MSTPLVSIVIVTHNNWPDLELAIESALGQTYASTETIVVDNDSTDDTAANVAAIFGDRLKYVKQQNLLDGGGYNRGIRESSGEFVQLLDADDFLAPNKIERQMAAFEEHPDADVVYGDVRRFQHDTGRGVVRDWSPVAPEKLLTELTRPGGESGLLIHSVLFRRSALERTGAWDESMPGVDTDYWMRAIHAGCKFVYAPGALVFYRQRSGQMSGDRPAMLNRIERTLVKSLEYVTAEQHRNDIETRLAAIWFSRAVLESGIQSRERMSLLRKARSTDPSQISGLLYALGVTTVFVPGARGVIKSRMLTRIRRWGARSLGLQIKRPYV